MLAITPQWVCVCELNNVEVGCNTTSVYEGLVQCSVCRI